MNSTNLATLMIFLVAVSATKFDTDYCANEMKCHENNVTKEHLLCKFKHESSKGDCTNIRGRMTPDERMHILAFHNLYRNEMGMDPVWVKYPAPDEVQYARPEPDNWLQGFAGALCIRQLTWAYNNEKAAQIWAEQCMGDKETYSCITDFKEEFPQFMSVYTADGTVDGEEAMRAAFDYWRATNTTMKGDRKQPAIDKYTTTVYNENKLEDFEFDEKTEFLPWANLVYWKTFLLGCGKAHYQIGGKDKTRIVCVYGPGINYIDTFRKRGTTDHLHRALYIVPNNYTHRQCTRGAEGDPYDKFLPDHPGYIYFPSCPYFYLCYCRGSTSSTYPGAGGRNGTHAINFEESSWPWLCSNDCQETDIHPRPIPGLMEYIIGTAPSRSCSSHALVLCAAAYSSLISQNILPKIYFQVLLILDCRSALEG